MKLIKSFLMLFFCGIWAPLNFSASDVKPVPWAMQANVSSGKVNNLSVVPSVYNEEGEWVSVVNGGFTTLVVTYGGKIPIPNGLTEAMVKTLSKPPAKPLSEYNLIVGLPMKDLIILHVPEMKSTYGIAFNQAMPLIHPLRQVVEGVYQFDPSKETYVAEEAVLLAKIHELAVSEAQQK